MASPQERLWRHHTYAVVGRWTENAFPKLTYDGLKAAGKRVFAVDPSVRTIEGDRAYPDLASLPTLVDAVVLDVPPEETEAWVKRAAKAGIGRVWIHRRSETREAVDFAKNHGLEVHTGGSVAMYFAHGFNARTLRTGLRSLLGKS